MNPTTPEAPMDPAMAAWLDELDTTKNPRTAVEEARRFLDVVNRGGYGSAAAAYEHARWKARPGFKVVLARAIELTAR